MSGMSHDSVALDPAPTGAPARRLRRFWCVVRAFVTGATLVAIALGLAGHLARDRNLALALLMYIPIVPLGLWALVFDLLRRGKSVRPRFAFALMGLVCVLWG